MLLNFLVHEDTFYSIFSSKNISEKNWPKIYLGQDPDPDPEPDPDFFESRIRIRTKIVRIRNTAQKVWTVINSSVAEPRHFLTILAPG
jgi:hypothetical protein